MQNLFLYLGTVLIWGSTFLVITFQLGEVQPLVSVAYRFLLAAAILLLFIRLRGLRLRFSLSEHRYIALQGACLFGINYWLIYLATQYLTSGLIAVLFSTVVFMNVFNGWLFTRQPIRPEVVLGGVLGLAGICLVFWPELAVIETSAEPLLGIGLALAATYSASIGNIVSSRNQKAGIPVLQGNGIGMLYGGVLMTLLALFGGSEFTWDARPQYLVSLLYLALFGSVIAFGCYLTLVGRLGADRAAYATLLFPIVALQLSHWFEGYQWSASGLLGVALVLVGNAVIVLGPARIRRWLGRPEPLDFTTENTEGTEFSRS